mgnify:CR=1 FL=1
MVVQGPRSAPTAVVSAAPMPAPAVVHCPQPCPQHRQAYQPQVASGSACALRVAVIRKSDHGPYRGQVSLQVQGQGVPEVAVRVNGGTTDIPVPCALLHAAGARICLEGVRIYPITGLLAHAAHSFRGGVFSSEPGNEVHIVNERS